MIEDDVPVWAFERVEVLPADPAWQEQGRALAASVEHALGPWLTGRVAHIGSTSVPALAAKPVLDLMAPVDSFDGMAAAAQALAPAGWVLVPPELDGRPHRRFLVHVVDDRRHAHLHLVLDGTGELERHLAFRDRLRGDPALRDAYAALKTDLAARLADDRDGYTAAKAGFVESVLHAGTAEP